MAELRDLLVAGKARFLNDLQGAVATFSGNVTAPKFIGALEGKASSATSADSATKATQDGGGNVIASTYAVKNHASTATTYGVGNESHYGHVILYPAASCTSFTSDDGGAITPAAAKKAVTLFTNDYAPTKTGGGASGTWGINITGNAATATSATSATKLATARTLSISGTAGGTAPTFNGTANVTLSVPKNISSLNRLSFTTTDNGTSPTAQSIVLNGVENSTDTGKAPGIGFHIGGKNWGSLKFLSDGTFRFYNNDCSGYKDVYANTFYGNLSGNATTATSATSASSATIANRLNLNGISNDTKYGTYGGIIQDSNTGPNSGAWHNTIKILHNNSTGYYTSIATQFTGEDGLWFKSYRNGVDQGWKRVAVQNMDNTFSGTNNFTTTKTEQSYGHHTAATYTTTNSNSGYYKIKINSANNWMTAFTIRVYQSYKWSDIVISGYNYGASYWYSPVATMLGSSTADAMTVYFGYDSAYNLWVGIPASSYTGIDIIDVTNGYQAFDSYKDLFTITNVSSLGGTTQSTQTVYRPWYRNETVTNATNAANATYATSAGSANSVAWNNVTGKPSTYSPSAHNHIQLAGWADTRSATTTPNDYNGVLKVVGIKQNNTIPIDGSSYSTLVGIRGWSDSSGGNAHELAFTGNGNLYHRHGATTSWSGWNRIPMCGTDNTFSGSNTFTGSLTWNNAYWTAPGNIICNKNGTNAEFSFDMGAGTQWHVWSTPSSRSILSCWADTSHVQVPVHLYVGSYNNTSYALSTSSFICESWIRTTGNTGWYNETHGGGWYMTDGNYVRTYNNKAVFANNSYYVGTTGGGGVGLSLYGTSAPNNYGIHMSLTSNYGTHGPVQGDWANYFCFDGASNRGWIFKQAGTNVASISGTGAARFDDSVFGYAYSKSNNKAAFIWDKPSSNYTGVGANGIADTIYFGACTGDGAWVTSYKQKWVFNGSITADAVWGAVWNDYAEFRELKEKENEIPYGRVVIENNDDTLSLSTERLMPGGNICSDTFGFAIGETENAKMPIAVSGRVLVYTNEDRYSYKAGDAVCTGPNGTVSKMTREEIKEWPDRIIGYVSAIPEYETWGQNDVKVDGRIWIKVV